MNKLTITDKVFVPVNVNDELPNKEDCYFVFTKGIEKFEDSDTNKITSTEFTHCGWHRFVNTFQGKYFSSLPKNETVTHWLKEETNKYVLSREELEKVISDAWKANHVDWYYDEKGNKIDNEMQKKQYINSIL